jgi:type I restriction enzyme S subunit
MVALRADESKVDPKYLFALLRSPQIQSKIEQMHVGTLIPHFKKGDFDRLLLPIPNRSAQRFIGDLYFTLSSKIDLNTRINEILEGMAGVLFKSWLVNFDPVRAKAEDRAFALPPALAELFPATFQDSDVGEIPSGWTTRGLDEVALFLNGLALQKFPPKNGRSLPVIKIAQLRTEDVTGADSASADLSPEYIVEDGDVLFSWSGSLECVLWAGGRGALNQHLFKVTSAAYPKWFYFQWIRQHLADFRGIAAGKATTMGHIQRHHLSAAKAIVPSGSLLKEMDRYFSPLIDQIVQNKVASRSIAAIRDALLPRLVSGEIRVPDAERISGRSV